MRQVINFKINKESTGDMIKTGRFNPCLEITFRDRSGQYNHKFSAGYSDEIDIYRDGIETYVLSTNVQLDYVGLEVFEGPEKQGSIFLQGDQVKEVLGKENLAPLNAIKRLREHIHVNQTYNP